MLILTCLKIFFARIIDVSLGTIRTILFVKGKTIEPFIIAFIEVMVWYFIAREALNINSNAIIIAISYAGGYATGTYIGSILSKFIKGIIGVQVITNKANKLVSYLRKKEYAVSVIELKNNYQGDNKDMLYIQTNNGKLKELTNIINIYDKKAFIIVNETKMIQNGFVK
jgi:uncharacterized protein YebE (UPF0316 family)